MKSSLSPRNESLGGPEMTSLARTRSSLIADKQRAKTASPIRVTIVHCKPGRNAKRVLMWPTSSASVERGNSCPFTGSLLTSFVKNFSDNRFTIVIVKFEDICGNLNKERVKDAFVPLQENVGDFTLLEAEATLQNVVCFGDQLHVAILDTFRQVKRYWAEEEENIPLCTILT